MKPVRADELDIAEPLGLRGPGRRLPSTRASLYLRNAFLVEAALLFHRGASNNAAAIAIHKRIALYRAGAWRRHRVADDLPPALVGKIEELIWFALKQHDALPSERSIRAVLDRARKTLVDSKLMHSLPTARATLKANNDSE